MKTKLIGVLALLAGSTLFAAPRVAIGIGVGVPAYGYGYVAPAPPPPVYAAPVPAYGYVAPAPQLWVNGYWGYVGPRRVWYPGHYAPRPVYRGGWRR